MFTHSFFLNNSLLHSLSELFPLLQMKWNKKSVTSINIQKKSYATIISTDAAHALIDTIITLDKNIIDYIMKY